ncbi:hypothetical protein [Flavobacterium sp.]|uniref:DUF7793 family protein n=1 Tax=Flavobacterium sp. TaxID=239 RepID=UPI0025BA3DA5|nr:hypothetical protein [Flavobacterium sp.]MBA4155310.1 hypothetical protein [Flavobacterium sp.]MDP2161522.1 hypothetical protein [Flavobacterium sp.]
MYNNHYENEFAIFWIENNILLFEYKFNVIIDLLAAQQIVADRIQVQNGKAYPILCDISGIVDSDKAARDYLAQHGSMLTKAVAIVVADQKILSFLMITFYLKISKPQVPTKLFTDKMAALEFLKTFV